MTRRCELTGKTVITGNNVSHAHNKTRRRFLPNLQRTSLQSETLGQMVRLRITPYAMRTVDRHGGLDAFLLQAKDDKLSLNARRLKRRIAKVAAAAAG